MRFGRILWIHAIIEQAAADEMTQLDEAWPTQSSFAFYDGSMWIQGHAGERLSKGVFYSHAPEGRRGGQELEAKVGPSSARTLGDH
jgi:hypothetical protein